MSGPPIVNLRLQRRLKPVCDLKVRKLFSQHLNQLLRAIRGILSQVLMDENLVTCQG